MNNDLKDDVYTLPDNLLELLQTSISDLNPNDKGYSRCNSLVDDGSLTHSQAKKLKHELENELEGVEYDVVGGDEMLDFINLTLENRRKNTHNSKKIRQNAGEENVFKKTHTKDKTKNPTKVTTNPVNN